MQSVTSNAVAGAISLLGNYSPTPVVVGKWIDGVQDVKKLTINITFPLNESATTINLADYGIAELISCDGILSTVIENSQRYNFNINSMWDFGDSGWKIQWFFDTSSKNFYFQRGDAFYTRTCYGYITLFYV